MQGEEAQLNRIFWGQKILRDLSFIHSSTESVKHRPDDLWSCNCRTNANCPYLVSYKKPCDFSETTEQNYKSCSQRMCRGENVVNYTQNQTCSLPRSRRTRAWPDPEGWNPFRSEGPIVQQDLVLKPLTRSYHKWSNPKNTPIAICPASTSAYQPVPPNPVQLVPNSWSERQIWALPPVSLLETRRWSFCFLESQCHSIGF